MTSILVAVFMVTRLDLVNATPQVRDFIIDVLSNGALYEGSPWWTYFTSLWLHGSVYHLASNVISFLWLISNYQAALVTNRSWIAIYLLGGIVSGAVHILIHHNAAVDFTNWSAPLVTIYWQANSPLVGASGAIFALWGATTAAAFRYMLLRKRGVKNPMPIGLRFLFILAASQFAMDPFFPGIAATAHLVGFGFGCVAGFLPTLRTMDSLVTTDINLVKFVSAQVSRIYTPPIGKRNQVEDVTFGLVKKAFGEQDSVGILSREMTCLGGERAKYKVLCTVVISSRRLWTFLPTPASLMKPGSIPIMNMGFR
jgi:membrane associated rhomboid family serine protease